MNRTTITILLVVVITYSLFYVKPLMIKQVIPRVTHKGAEEKFTIFRTWKSREMDSKMVNRCHDRWFDLNRSLSMEWYDDADCEAFMRTQDPRIYNAYTILKPTAFKADLFRLCVLYENGGMYVDAQTMPYVSIRKMLNNCYKENQKHVFISVLDSEFSKGGIHNGFMFCTPNHPFVKRCIERIVTNVENRDYTDHVLAVTGPICLRRAINDVLNRNEETPFKEGFNDFDDLSLYLYRLQWGPSQFVYKDNDVMMCKKHCLLTTFLAKMKKSAYEKMWRSKDIYK